MIIAHDNPETGRHFSLDRYERWSRWSWRRSIWPRLEHGPLISTLGGYYRAVRWLGWRALYQKHPTHRSAPMRALEAPE